MILEGKQRSTSGFIFFQQLKCIFDFPYVEQDRIERITQCCCDRGLQLGRHI